MYKVCALILAAALPGAAAPRLQIVVVEGEGAINNSRAHTGRDPVVEVRDDKDAPIAGAVVTFQAPANGASVVFSSGNGTLVTQTDASGRAIANGLKPNGAQGPFEIRVTVSSGAETASAVIAQRNALPAEQKSNSKKILLITLLAGAAAGGAVAATHGKSSAASTPSTAASGTIVAGTGSFGPPH